MVLRKIKIGRERLENGIRIRNLRGKREWLGCFGKWKKGVELLVFGGIVGIFRKVGMCFIVMGVIGKCIWVGMGKVVLGIYCFLCVVLGVFL